MASEKAADRRSILVVDDEEGMRYTARRILQSRYEVTEAASGEEAIDILGERIFHVALVDVRLPGLSGLELLATIKVMSPSTEVVIMTGSVKDPDEALLSSIRSKAYFFLRKPFSASVLQTLIDRISETQRLQDRVRQHSRRLEEDLESARIFQQGLLPVRDWKDRRLEVAGLYVPSRQLSGDLIDYWTLPGARTALLVADVMGHGASSAMLTGIVKTQIRTLAVHLTDPARILEELDRSLQSVALRRFLTILLVIDDGPGKELRFCGAGHPPGLLRCPDGRLEQVISEGLPLNLDLPETVARTSGRLERISGAQLFLYSDGFAESLSPDGLFLNETPGYADRIAETLASPPRESRDALEKMLLAHTGGRPQEDDRALLVARFR
ncbi:MAG: SpoIIE family protein phosphatase [Candidatus Eisenbacteria bacterium]|nr:SpoIIE family protein phosphatase [Candidatus Latescibacterota bacterium]MBD3301958.1 SpoIIE family protein phosphatase [Candidatus Eisenbacteria bacterium]